MYIYILYGVKAEQNRRNILSMKQSSDQLRNFCVNFERITIGLHKRGGYLTNGYVITPPFLLLVRLAQYEHSCLVLKKPLMEKLEGMDE